MRLRNILPPLLLFDGWKFLLTYISGQRWPFLGTLSVRAIHRFSPNTFFGISSRRIQWVSFKRRHNQYRVWLCWNTRSFLSAGNRLIHQRFAGHAVDGTDGLQVHGGVILQPCWLDSIGRSSQHQRCCGVRWPEFDKRPAEVLPGCRAIVLSVKGKILPNIYYGGLPYGWALFLFNKAGKESDQRTEQKPEKSDYW